MSAFLFNSLALERDNVTAGSWENSECQTYIDRQE